MSKSKNTLAEKEFAKSTVSDLCQGLDPILTRSHRQGMRVIFPVNIIAITCRRFRLRFDQRGALAERLQRHRRAQPRRRNGGDAHRDQRKDLFRALAASRHEAAPRQIVAAIEVTAAVHKARQNALADGMDAIRRGEHDEIFAADVPDEIVRVSLGGDRILDGPRQHANHLVPAPEAIAVVQRLEMIEIDIQKGPRRAGAHAQFQLLLDQRPAGQARQRRSVDHHLGVVHQG